MSDLFAMTDRGADERVALAESSSIDSFDELESPLWRGTGQGLAEGIMRGGAKAATGVGVLVGGTIGQALDSIPRVRFNRGNALGLPIPETLEQVSTDAQDAIFRASEEIGQNAVDFWTPKPNEVGRVGQVLGGLGEIVLPLAAGGGNPALLVNTTTANTGKELVDAGVDAGTAGTVAAVEGAAAYAGLKVPILGKNLTQRVGTGVAGNVALGASSRAVAGEILDSQGYGPQSERYAIDATSLTTDALTGLLFGGLVHVTSPRLNPKLTPEQLDAVMAARNSRSYAVDTAPGVAAGDAASAAHSDALNEALALMARGEEVTAARAVAENEGATFDADGRVAENAKLADEVAAQQSTSDLPIETTVETGAVGDMTIRSTNGHTDLQESGPYLIAKDSRTDKDAQGRGEGTARYLAAAREAEARGLTLASDVSVSPAQARVYERLERMGFHVERNPAEVNPETGNLVSSDGSPVFEVKPRDATDPGVSELPLDQALGAKPAEAEVTPEIVALYQVAEQFPDRRIDTGETDADGAPVYQTAREAADQAKADYEQAENDTRAYETAVACFLRAG